MASTVFWMGRTCVVKCHPSSFLPQFFLSRKKKTKTYFTKATTYERYSGCPTDVKCPNYACLHTGNNIINPLSGTIILPQLFSCYNFHCTSIINSKKRNFAKRIRRSHKELLAPYSSYKLILFKAEI